MEAVETASFFDGTSGAIPLRYKKEKRVKREEEDASQDYQTVRR